MLLTIPLNKCTYQNKLPIESNAALNMHNIELELNRQELLHINILLKQIKLETGNLKFIRNNNLFGFRNSCGYMKFKTWKDCVSYKKRWQIRRYKGGNYYRFLENLPYASDSNYIYKLKKMRG